jgi:glycosyltransferase involved in cell wall biosynthesis
MHKYKIAVNTRFLLKNKLEGIGWYTYENLRRITQAHKDIQFHFLFDRAYDESFIFSDNIIPHVVHPPARHPFLWYIWYEWMLSSKLKAIKPDLFISTDGMCSLSTKIPTHLTIHDIAFKHFPQYVGGITSKYYNHFTPKYVEKAKRIATVSTFSKNDLIQSYGTEASKIDIVYNGSKSAYTPYSMENKEAVKNKYSMGKNYFLYVGSMHPRKNIENLFYAFDEFKKNTNSDFKLVIAGRKAWQTSDIEKAYDSMHHKNEVIFLGHILPDELKDIYGGAYALTYVSHFEGFGIPILEAMNSQVPSIISNTSSMPEVGGDASIQVNPTDINQIALAMQQISTDQALYHSLIEKGKIQKEQFSWDKTATLYWESIVKCL